MRVGILSQWYDPEPGSAAVPGVLARGLRDRGHDVRVVTGFPNFPTGRLADGYQLRWRADEELDGIAVRRVALYPSHDRSPLRRAANYLSFMTAASAVGLSELRRCDALWVYNSPATVGLPSWLAGLQGGPPHLMHVMDLWPESIGFSGIGPGVYPHIEPGLRRWCDWTYRNAAAVAGISLGICDELTARGVPAVKVHYVPVWADESRFAARPRDTELARELGVTDRFVLLYAGNIGETQGLDHLIDACRRCSDLDDFTFLMVGSGTAETRLRRRVEELGLGCVRFLGRWPSRQMGRLMSVGDLHLVSLANHPLARITFPSKLPSTLASGRPVLASASGEVARVVRESGAGWVVAPGDVDGLETAIRDAHAAGPRALGVMGQRARQYYDANLSQERGIAAVEGLLSGMWGKTAVPPPAAVST